jgi:hypothetical protein
MLRSLTVALYWTIVVHFLQSASPVSIDSSGPMPSFCWAKMPHPDLAEYNRRRGYYDFVYGTPYLLAGSILTFAGWVAAPRLRRLVPSSQRIAGTIAAAFVLTLLLAILSDAGTHLGICIGPLFLLHWHYGLDSFAALSKVLIPAPVLAGLAEVSRRRLL